MLRKSYLIVALLILSMGILSSCNLPTRQTLQTQTPTPASITSAVEYTPTPIVSMCDNVFFPNASGDTWEYSGSNTAIGAYTRTDAVSNSGDKAFTVDSKLSGVTYPVEYTCTETGLIANNPIQQYLGALLSGPDAPVSINLISNSGISLPATINIGDSWKQTAEWEASGSNFAMNGRFVFNYSAVGYEKITVLAGTYDALRVNATIRIEISGLRVLAGTYETTTWMAPNVGVVKSEGTSHVPGVDFSDSLELTRYTSVP